MRLTPSMLVALATLAATSACQGPEVALVRQVEGGVAVAPSASPSVAASSTVPPVVSAVEPTLAPPGGRVGLRGTGLKASRGQVTKVTVGGLEARLLAAEPERAASAAAGEWLAIEVPAAAEGGEVIVTVGGVASPPARFSLVRALRLEGPSTVPYGAAGRFKVFATDGEGRELQTGLIPPEPQDGWGVRFRDGAFEVRPTRLGVASFRVGAGPVQASLDVTTETWACEQPLPVLEVKGFAVGGGRVWWTDGAGLFRSDDAGTGWVEEVGAAVPGQVLSGLALDGEGRLCYGDRASVRVLGEATSTLLCGEPTAPGGEDGDGLTARLGTVRHLARERGGPLHLTDGDQALRVRQVRPDGSVRTVALQRSTAGPGPAPAATSLFGVARGSVLWTGGLGGFFALDVSTGTVRSGVTRDFVPSTMAVSADARAFLAAGDKLYERRRPLVPLSGGLEQTLDVRTFSHQRPFSRLVAMAFDPEGHLWVIADRPASGGMVVEHFGLPPAP